MDGRIHRVHRNCPPLAATQFMRSSGRCVCYRGRHMFGLDVGEEELRIVDWAKMLVADQTKLTGSVSKSTPIVLRPRI